MPAAIIGRVQTGYLLFLFLRGDLARFPQRLEGIWASANISRACLTRSGCFPARFFFPDVSFEVVDLDRAVEVGLDQLLDFTRHSFDDLGFYFRSFYTLPCFGLKFW